MKRIESLLKITDMKFEFTNLKNRFLGAATKGEGGGRSPSNAILATFPNRPDLLSFLRGERV